MEKISLAQKLLLFGEPWSPKVIAELNGQHVKLARMQGEFVWHSHEEEDELFLVLRGRFCMQLREGDIWVEEGEMLVVPRGIEHCPLASEECCVLLFEPASTVNTGEADSELRLEPEALDWI
ncbi:cupin domain-containing protein [bacterium]|nr:cupin domain-containing protein [bacterium]